MKRCLMKISCASGSLKRKKQRLSFFSTFLGRAGIYLENLYVKPEYRGKGLIKTLAEIATERGCGRLEWACLDWNRPSIDFYLSLGAVPQKEERHENGKNRRDRTLCIGI